MGSSEIDDIDKAIIVELQVDGRLPYAKLAPLVGLSEAATRQRVNKLIERGAMQIVAVTDPAAIGLQYQAWLGITVDRDVREVAAALAKIDQIDYLVIVTGRYDLALEVFCTNSTEFLTLISEQIRPIPGIVQIETMNYLELVKQSYNWGTG